MPTATAEQDRAVASQTAASTAADEFANEPPFPEPSKKSKRPSTAHLKLVPQERPLRDRIRREAKLIADTLDHTRPLTKDFLQKSAAALLAVAGQPESYLGFTMVTISNEFWREQFMATDFKRRLLLLPHCLKHAEGCPADYDEFGLDCRKCGACSIADFKVTAEDLGYKVLVAEGTPIVLKIIIGGHVDSVLGVACLNVLEKAIDKVLLAGVPSLAIPLLSSDCKNTSVDEDWVAEVIGLRTEPPKSQTRSYLPLMRMATRVCEGAELERIAPRARKEVGNRQPEVATPHSELRTPHSNGNGHTASNGNGHRTSDPLAITEEIAFDWLGRGGKRSRPFITLAAYDALKGGAATLRSEAESLDELLPDPVRRAALAIETFHKASLVHDDIEDDDTYRYGRETLHRKHGVPTAINVGDYLIGLGYRLLSRDRREVGGDCAADVLDKLADAHLKLAEGQGAELAWRDSAHDGTPLTPLDTLKIYALKTSPAFEAALYAGLRLAGPTEKYDAMIPAFARHLGVAFQILNDLKDWEGDDNNKLVAGQDALAARPTLLLALALEGLAPAERNELFELIHSPERSPATVARLRRLFDSAGVFDKAEKLIDKYRERAEATADDVEPTELRELLYFMIDTVLDREPTGTAAAEPIVPATPLVSLPIVQGA